MLIGKWYSEAIEVEGVEANCGIVRLLDRRRRRIRLRSPRVMFRVPVRRS